MLNHPRHRVDVALSVLAMVLGVAFIPTLLAQRVAPTPQDAPLRTLTLDGKGGTPMIANTQAGSQPRPITRAQRLTLFKGRTPIESFTLTPKQPTFSDKAGIYFVSPSLVMPNLFSFSYAAFGGGSTGRVYFYFKAKVGKHYALDFSVRSISEGTFTVTNPFSEDTLTTPAGVAQAKHITAYVIAGSESLEYYLMCSSQWEFFSVEVTEL